MIPPQYWPAPGSLNLPLGTHGTLRRGRPSQGAESEFDELIDLFGAEGVSHFRTPTHRHRAPLPMWCSFSSPQPVFRFSSDRQKSAEAGGSWSPFSSINSSSV